MKYCSGSLTHCSTTEREEQAQIIASDGHEGFLEARVGKCNTIEINPCFSRGPADLTLLCLQQKKKQGGKVQAGAGK